MAKKSNEQEAINKERLIDIVLIMEYIKAYDLNHDFFTDKGEGFLEGLVSLKDYIKFVSKAKYDKDVLKAQDMYTNINIEYNRLNNENKKLNKQIDYYKKYWKKKLFKW